MMVKEDSTIGDVLNFNSELRRKWENNRKPYAAFMELTSRCNFNCVHCYLQDHHDNEELSFDEIIEIIDILYDNGILFLTFSGGEVFSRKDFLDIYIYAKKKGFLIEVFSNGYAITDDALEIFNELPPLLVDISLYGATEETYAEVTGVKGAFNKVIDNIKKLRASNIRVSLKSPIIRETVNEIELMRELANGLKVPFAISYEITRTIDGDTKSQEHMLDVHDMLRLEFEDYYRLGPSEDSDEYIHTDNIFICNIAKGSFVIDYKGNLCPCMKFRHRGVRFNKDNYLDIWRSFGNFYKLRGKKEYACTNCDARYYCDFCPAEREFVLGNMEATDPCQCAYAKTRHSFYNSKCSIEEALSLYDHLLRKEGTDEL